MSPTLPAPVEPSDRTLPFPLETSIPELQLAMEEGRLTSVGLVETYLARIDAYDTAGPTLRAFIHVNAAAREQAAALDAERAASGSRGPLHGIPVVVKDNLDTADMPTTAGSVALAGFRPSADAFQVAKLREAGAVILGKTNLCEFATCAQSKSTLGGQTLDPYDISRDPGGSSGGTAVAVTADLAAAGLGTDTCGSVRLPAGHTNLYGLRPTSGLSSRAGSVPFSSTLDEIGPMARSVIDLALVLDATVGRDPADPTTIDMDHAYAEAVTADGLADRRIGVRAFPSGDPVGNVVRAALDEMTVNGAETVDIVLPPSPIREAPWLDEFSDALATYLAARPEAPVRTIDEILAREPFEAGVTPRLRELAAAPSVPTDVLERSERGRTEWRDILVAFMDEAGIDAIAYPVSTRPAALIGGEQENFDCTLAVFSGLPAIAIPAGFTKDGLPIGMELLGRPFQESTLIAIAAGFEAHTDHRHAPPSTPALTMP